MKYFTLFPLQGYWGKWAGGIIATAALFAGLLVTLTDVSILDRLAAPDRQIPAIAFLLGVGLYTMALSKEKIDDERVQHIRYTALRGALMLNFIAAFSLLFPAILSPGNEPFLLTQDDLTPLICLLLVGPSLLYLIIFHIGLQLDAHWAYNDLGAEENIRKNRWLQILLIAELLLCLGLIVLMLLKN